MDKLIRSAEYICIATNQIGIEYSTNEFGSGPHLKAANEPIDRDYIHWRDDRFRKWLDRGDGDRRRVLRAPATEGVAVDEDKNELYVEMARIISPGIEDFRAYAARCGCKAIDEAQNKYGDLEWVYDKFYVLVKGTEVREFLMLVVPYCWVRCY